MTSMYSYNITLSSVTDRGYTSHEHLPNFGLINMNVPIKREQSQACLNYAEREAHRGEASTYGRVYDPMTMNFLSPDPVLQNPNNSQNYNRYSYCLNNPLKYVDPSGYTALYPWYEHIAGPNTYYTHYNDISDPTYTDGSGRVWQYKAESFETANFIGNSDGSWVYKNFENYNEIIALFNNYDETQTTQQDNLSQSNNFKFTAGAGSLRIEGEGIERNNASGQEGDWVSDAWSWTKDHFYIGAEGEITYGIQLSGIVYKGAGLNINSVSQVVAEGKVSNRGGYGKSYQIVPAAHMDKGKALDLGVAWIVGGNYNWNIENGKHVSSTFSLGVYGIGGSLTWDKTGVSNLFVGFELGGKVAAGWGAGGSVKIGFNWDW